MDNRAVDTIGQSRQQTPVLGLLPLMARSILSASLPSVDPSWLPEHLEIFIATMLELRLQWLKSLV
jgi:hypothetical protein